MSSCSGKDLNVDSERQVRSTDEMNDSVKVFNEKFDPGIVPVEVSCTKVDPDEALYIYTLTLWV